MKTLFYYCYYKFSKFYENWGEKDGHIAGSIVLFGSFAFILLSFLAFIFSLLKIKFNTTFIWAVFIVFGILSLFFIKKKKYKELEERYKNEKHSKLKGWLLFLYFIGSIALYIIFTFVFDV